MDEAWRKRLLDRMEELDLTPAELTKRAGVGSTMIHDIMKRGVTPSVANLAKLASALGLRLIDLFEDNAKIPVVVRPTGRVGGGDMWTEAGAPVQDLKIDFFQSDLVALTVETNDLLPFYRAGDTLCGPRSIGAHIDNHIGTDCIILTADNQRLVRTLQRGSVQGRYTLRSLERSAPDIPNVAIAWAAPIKMILR